MRTVLASVVALGVSAALARLLSSPRSRVAILDHPNDRSLHATPTPRTGGLAIMAGLLAGATGLAFAIGGVPAWMAWALGGALVVAAISFCDDRWTLSPFARLVLQLSATSAAVLWGGIVLSSAAIPGAGGVAFGRLAAPITVLLIVWMANLYNFMDGMDGLAGGMAVAGFGLLGVAARASDPIFGAFGLIAAASAAGFLAFNLPPGRIFMGDVGSVPLGFLAGVLAVRGAQRGLFDIWIPILVFSPFIVDATIVLTRRVFRGRPVWRPHREHGYQRLVLAGWTQRRTLASEYILMAAAGASALLYARSSDGLRLLLLAAWLAIYALLYHAVALVERRRRQVPHAAIGDSRSAIHQ